MKKTQQIILALVLIAVAVSLRVFNVKGGLLNFSPLMALSLFAGYAFTDKKIGFLVPLAALVLSDIAVGTFTQYDGFYGWSQLITYLAYLIVYALGTQIQSPKPLRVLGFTLSGAMIFFIVSNFGTWADTVSNMYPKTWQGLVQCYTAGIAFYRQQVEANDILNPLTADILYAAILFGLFAFATRTSAQKQLA